MDPTFLSLTEVLEIHRDQVVRYGGAAGIRDIELLKSALGMPSAIYGGQFLHTDIYEMAAAYLEGPEGDAIRRQSPLGRVARAEEVASVVAYLAADGSDFLTGGIIDVSGASYLRS